LHGAKKNKDKQNLHAHRIWHMKRNQKLKLSKKNESKVKKKGNVQSVKSKEREKKKLRDFIDS